MITYDNNSKILLFLSTLRKSYLLLKLFDNRLILDMYKDFDDSISTLNTAESYRNFKGMVNRMLDMLVVNYQTRVGESLRSLEAIYLQLEEFDDLSNNTAHISGDKREPDISSRPFGAEVFIVHGRDDGAKETVARFVEKLNLKATILHEQPNEGRTIIEKLEDCADRAGFAIVLLTPDDVGTLRDNTNSQGEPRARQNVVFELGYFMGKLGRKRVCPLFKGEIEKPSDIDGVVYVPMDSKDWKLKLCQEMKNAGFSVDVNKIF